MVYLALTYDHRLVDGADAARFLQRRQGAPRGRPVRGLTAHLPRRCRSSSPAPPGSSGSHLDASALVGRGHAVVGAGPPSRRPAPGRVELGPVRRHLRPRGRSRPPTSWSTSPGRRRPATRTPTKWARELRESRVRTTATLAEAIAGVRAAAGVPGRQRDRATTATTATRWSTEAVRQPGRRAADRGVAGTGRPPPSPAVEAGARVCVLRTAPVMDRRSPPLKQLRLLFRLGARRPGSVTAGSTCRWSRCATGSAASSTSPSTTRAAGPFNLFCPDHADQRGVHRRAGPPARSARRSWSPRRR